MILIYCFQGINISQNSGRLNHWINILYKEVPKKPLPFPLLRQETHADCLKRLTCSTRVAPYLL